MATTAARHAGRAAELAWPPSSHADIVEARGASLWRPAVVMAIEMLEQQAVALPNNTLCCFALIMR